jgi:hypothetical protein
MTCISCWSKEKILIRKKRRKFSGWKVQNSEKYDDSSLFLMPHQKVKRRPSLLLSSDLPEAEMRVLTQSKGHPLAITVLVWQPIMSMKLVP